MTWLSSILSALLKIVASWFSKKELEEKHIIIHKTEASDHELEKLNTDILAAADNADWILQDKLIQDRAALLQRRKTLRLAQRDEG